MRLKTLFGVALTFIGITGTQAATINVPDDYPTIQGAINAAAEGDTIEILPGRYFEKAIRSGKTIVVRSTDPSNDVIVQSTVIDGLNQDRVIILDRSGDSGLVLQGLTITGGGIDAQAWSPTIENCRFIENTMTVHDGGALRVSLGSPVVRNTLFADNYNAQKGGAVYVEDGTPIFWECQFIDNSATFGGAAHLRRSNAFFYDCSFELNGGSATYMVDCSPTFNDCRFTGNHSIAGGAVGLSWGTRPEFNGCTFTGNHTSEGGGAISGDNGGAELRHCTFTDNTSGGGSVIDLYISLLDFENCLIVTDQETAIDAPAFCEVSLINSTVIVEPGNQALVSVNSSLTVHNSILVGSDSPIDYPGSDELITYSNIQGGWLGLGNIDADPKFRSYGGFDYVLKPKSPCVDTGDPSIQDEIYDWHLQWPAGYVNGARSDMGAYGGPENGGWLN